MISEQAATAERRRRVRPGTSCALLAALVYLGCALYVMAPVLTAPRDLLPYSRAAGGPPEGRIARLVQRDHRMVVSVVARNAAALTSRPWQLFGDGQCYPMPRGYTLGENMFGLGFLAAIPWALTHDPILSFNVALVLTLWLPALSMYALSLHFTRSAPAAFVAGLLFALLPRRLSDPAHPYIHGDLWTPLALLFLHRLFTRGGWWNAAGLSLFTSLVLCESLYPLAGLAILLGVYGPYLLVRHRDRLRAIAPQLAVVAVWVLAVAWLVFGPYHETRSTWGLLAGRRPVLLGLNVHLPGSLGFPGVLSCALVVLALLDRLRGPRRVGGDDPRLVFLAAGILIVALTIATWTIPLLGVRFASPLALAARILPGLDAVRALPQIGISAGLPFAFVAGYGVRVLTERARPVLVALILAAMVALVFVSRFHPLLARPIFGASLALSTFHARPPEPDIALYRAEARGALLDLPFSWQGAKRLAMAEDLLRASYSPRPTAACYNSFVSPVQRQVAELAAALPDARAGDALAALGFETVLLEKAQLLPLERGRFRSAVRAQEDGSRRLSQVGETARLVAFRLSSPADVRSDYGLLASAIDGAAEDTSAIPAHGGKVAFVLRNDGRATFRHPDPLTPSELLLRWTDASGATVHEQRLRALLPIALGAGATSELELVLTAPRRAGLYSVQMARAAEPSVPLARRSVRVGAARPARQSR